VNGDYDAIRQFADSYGLAAMVVVFLTFTLWLFRPGARHHYDDAATMIFAEDSETDISNRDNRHG
jgi:cytochrome c oxidase cbb3-type subunit IV